MRPPQYATCIRICRTLVKNRVSLRFYSTDRLLKPETAVVPCRNNGVITLDIYRPRQQFFPPEQSENANSVLIYLPRGPIFESEELVHDGIIAATLAEAASTTVVQINYRLDPTHRFPTPIHDVAAGYDWVVQNLASPRNKPVAASPDVRDAMSSTDIAASQTRIGVCGEFLGGTLALSLGLTECKLPPSESSSDAPRWGGEHDSSSSDARVVAVASNNAIVDWVLPLNKTTNAHHGKGKLLKAALSNDTDESQIREKDDILDSKRFLKAQNSLFYPTRLADRFDPFVSPILFLRTPGVVAGEDSEADLSSEPQMATIDKQEGIKDSQEGAHGRNVVDRTGTEAPAANLISSQTLPTSSVVDRHKLVNETADDTVVIPWLEDSQPDASSTSRSEPTRKKPYKPRKVALRYPPSSMLPMAFPAFQLNVGTDSLLRKQNMEMAGLLQRAFGRYKFPGKYATGTSGKSRPQNNPTASWETWGSSLQNNLNLQSHVPEEEIEQQYMEEVVQKQVQINFRGSGAGFWCCSQDSEREGRRMWDEAEVQKIGMWMGSMLRN